MAGNGLIMLVSSARTGSDCAIAFGNDGTDVCSADALAMIGDTVTGANKDCSLGLSADSIGDKCGEASCTPSAKDVAGNSACTKA